MTTATASDLDELKRSVPMDEYFRRHGSTQDTEERWRCPCPSLHTNGDAHHSVTIRDGKATCWSRDCFGGKDADIFAVVGAVEGLADFMSQKRRVQELAGVATHGTARTVRQAYRWEDADGHVAFKIRWDTDDNTQAKCAWALDQEARRLGKGKCKPTVYAPSKVAAASRILLCEGERDTDTVKGWLADLDLPDLVATTLPNGAHDVKATYLKPLYQKTQVLLTGDTDDPGRDYVQKCGALLHGHVADLRHLVVPDGVKDWTEWKESGATAQDFLCLLDAAPRWTPVDAPHVEAEPVIEAKPTVEVWPVLDDAALHGLAGDVVRLFDPHTEADPVAVLVSVLAEVGAMLGRTPHLILDGSYHPLLFWPVLVGKTSKSRKGTAEGRSEALCRLADPAWTRGASKGTLSSGEGLAYAVRDAVYEDQPIKEKGRPTGEVVRVQVDAGIHDKRLFLVQTEFGSVLRVMARDGNSLSGALRDVWDGKNLAPMTKTSRVLATAPHVGIVGHVTQAELLRNLTSTDANNGFGNRFGWFAVRRSKELPFSSSPDARALHAIAGQFGARLQLGRTIGQFTLDDAAHELWHDLYHDLSADRPGLAGVLLGRAEAQVMRLAALYAVLDGTPQITALHLKAAVAVWDHAEQSVFLLFGDRTGDPDADTILAALRQAGQMTDTEISALFNYHRSQDRLTCAKLVLRTAGLATVTQQETGGRPLQIWRPTPSTQTGAV